MSRAKTIKRILLPIGDMPRTARTCISLVVNKCQERTKLIMWLRMMCLRLTKTIAKSFLQLHNICNPVVGIKIPKNSFYNKFWIKGSPHSYNWSKKGTYFLSGALLHRSTGHWEAKWHLQCPQLGYHLHHRDRCVEHHLALKPSNCHHPRTSPGTTTL